MGEIHLVGLNTIIGWAIGLEFPADAYIHVDSIQPTFLLDCATLEQMEMLQDCGNDKYSWLDSDKSPVYILSIWVGDSYTWLPPD